MDAPVIPGLEWDDITEKALLLEILRELRELNATMAKAYGPRPEPTCCEQEKNRIKLGTLHDPTLWECSVCGTQGR